jgi:hypothetical protein
LQSYSFAQQNTQIHPEDGRSNATNRLTTLDVAVEDQSSQSIRGPSDGTSCC